jgi:hypothetical protein
MDIIFKCSTLIRIVATRSGGFGDDWSGWAVLSENVKHAPYGPTDTKNWSLYTSTGSVNISPPAVLLYSSSIQSPYRSDKLIHGHMHRHRTCPHHRRKKAGLKIIHQNTCMYPQGIRSTILISCSLSAISFSNPSFTASSRHTFDVINLPGPILPSAISAIAVLASSI